MGYKWNKKSLDRTKDVIRYIERKPRNSAPQRLMPPRAPGFGGQIVLLTSTLTARAAGLLGHSDMGIVQRLDQDGNISNADPEKLVKVWNLSTHIVAAGKYVICTSINGNLVANWADC